MPEGPKSQEYVRPKEVPKRWPHISERRVRQLIADREIEFFRFGRAILLTPEALDALPQRVPALA